MSAPISQQHLQAGIQEIEDFANGLNENDRVNCVDLFYHPRNGVWVITPNESWLKVEEYLGYYILRDVVYTSFDMTVLQAPNCPEYIGDRVGVLVDADGAIHFRHDALP